MINNININSRLTAAKFQVGYVTMTNSYLDTDCQVNPFEAGGDVSGQDFLFIPQGESIDGLRGDKWCGVSAEEEIIMSKLFIYDIICLVFVIIVVFQYSFASWTTLHIFQLG